MQPTVPVSYAKRLLDQAKSVGCKIDEILNVVGIDQSYLDRREDISALQYGELYQTVMLYTRDEWFGIFADGKVPLGAFRLMCLTLLNCNNLRQAIILAGEFAEICRGLNVRYLLSSERETEAILTLSPSRSMKKEEFDLKVKRAEPESLVASIIMWHRLSEWLIGQEIPIHKITVSFSKNAAEKFPFDVPPVEKFIYDAAANSASYSSKYLDYPIVRDQDSLMAFLRTAPTHLVTEDPKHISTSEKVRNILKRDVSQSMPSAESVASQLNMSVTTMRRQLQKDDTSYQKLKDQCRLEAAFHYLACLDLSNNDIAELLGFDETSAFFRSFKKWTGQTPGEYRAQLQ